MGAVDRIKRWFQPSGVEARSLAVKYPDPIDPPTGVEYPPPPASGIPLFSALSDVHDELTRRLTEQRDTVDKLDGKASGLIAFLAAAAALTALGSDVFSSIPHAQTTLVVLLVLALLSALATYWPRAWLSPPNPETYATYIHWTPDQAHAAVMASLYAAIVINSQTQAKKLWWLDWCFRLIFASGLVFGVTVALHLEKLVVGH